MRTAESGQVRLTRKRDFKVVPAANTAQRVENALKVVLDDGAYSRFPTLRTQGKLRRDVAQNEYLCSRNDLSPLTVVLFHRMIHCAPLSRASQSRIA